jgi:8-oxo-dGTP pyrophosphatase MutT (NUDIX family)
LKRAGRLKQTLELGAMLALRYAPVPWWLKRRAIRLTQPKVIVISVAVIPDSAGRVLLLRARYAGRWQLPGGVVHGGEDPRAGVVRECLEELGRFVTVERLTGIYADRLGPELAFCFRCAPLDGTPVLSPEHEAFRYAMPDRAAPRLRRMIEDALAGHDEPCIDVFWR